MKAKEDLISELKNEKLPIIIFGAATVGEVLYYACEDEGIRIECFCDNNKNKTKNKLCNLEIKHPLELKKEYPQAIFLISVSDIKDVVDQLENIGYKRWYPSNSFLRDYNIYKNIYTVPMEFVEYAVSASNLCQDNYLNPDKLFLRSVDLIITERCSLKCRDCSNLTQYYKNPQNIETRELIDAIGRFFNIVDEVNEIRVLGGEPFMNKDAHIVIKRLIDEPKVKKIVIYTNGTILPNPQQIEILKSKKVLFYITDYGKLSRNIDSLIKSLKENGIGYFSDKPKGWTNCSKIYKHNRTLEEQKIIFANCCVKNTFTLSKCRLYRCPFSANAGRLNAVPNFKEDYIDIFEDIDIERIKNKIKKFALNKEFIEACDFCNGRTFGDPEIEPGIQTEKPLDYQTYE